MIATICPGCEKPIEEYQPLRLYFDDLWHEECANEDERYHQAWDAEDRYRHEFDE